MDFNINSRRLSFPTSIKMSYPHDIKKLIITWDKIANPDKDITSSILKIVDVKYNVYRSNTINGTFFKLNSKPLDTNQFIDENLSLNPNTNYWYKISTVAIFSDGSFSESIFSQPQMYKVENTNKWFNKVNERNMWILKNTGILMDLYVRKTEGEHCPDCWDDVRGQAINSKCEKCFGTGIIGGYEPMLQIYVRQKPAVQQLDLASQGYMINSNPGLWTISSIKLHNRDILINPEGRMFSITSANISHAAGYYFHQELQAKEVDPMDVKYHIQRKTLYPELN